MEFAALQRLRLQRRHLVRGTAGVATGSLQVLMHEVKRLLLETDTTWEAGGETYACF